MDLIGWVIEWDNLGQTLLWPLYILFCILLAVVVLLRNAVVAIWEWISSAFAGRRDSRRR